MKNSAKFFSKFRERAARMVLENLVDPGAIAA